jgi:Ni/Co efflux regulator RcnB
VPRILSLVMAGLLAVALAQPAFAEAKTKGKQQTQRVERDAADVLPHATITAAETTIIYDFIRRYGVQSFGPPQGLPPGIAKNLARGKPLPPGIAKRYVPSALLAQLPPRPGYEWLAVDRDILLVVAATEIIVGILRDVL